MKIVFWSQWKVFIIKKGKKMESILEQKSKLNEHQLSILASEMEKNKKSTGLAYVLWFFIGSLGIHKFYIGKGVMGFFYLAFGAVAWILLIVGLVGLVGETATSAITLSTVLFVIVGILLLLDLFTIPRQIRKTYEKTEIKNINKLLNSVVENTTDKEELINGE